MELKTGYKKTEAGLIPEDWNSKNLGDVMIHCFSGATPSRRHPEFYKGNIRWITSGELNYNIITDTNEKISKDALVKTNLKLIPKGTFLMAITGLEAEGTRGSCGIVGEESATNQSCMAIFPTSELLTEYLFHYYVYKGKVLALKYCQGTKQQSYTAKIVKLIPVPLPPSLEQRAIATALSDVDALIAALDRLIVKKRDIKQAAMQELITGRRRLPEFSTRMAYTQTEIGSLPEDWQIKSLKEIADIQRGASPRPIDAPIWYDLKSNVGWVRISDITASDGKHLLLTSDYLSKKGIENSRYLPSGSLIMSICATVGIPVITYIDSCIHDGFVGFSRLRGVDQEFLYYKLKELEHHFKSMGQTGSQSNLNTDLVHDCLIPLPSIPEQRAIAAILSDMDSEIAALETRHEKTSALKQGMMQELLTGRIRLVKGAEA